MLRKLVAIALIVCILFLALPVNVMGASNSFSDVKEEYWAKASIDYISNLGYMVGYGDRFGITDNITEGQFIAVLCRILGYPNQSPATCEEPAKELGLLKDNEKLNINGNLNRGDMAKYIIRAFELLYSDVEYPEYLEAYKGMIQDYELLNDENKLNALKCIEKGLMAGGPDGKFDVDGLSTRAQAAAVIHRLLSQKERDKVKPVFAEPDPEFEAFITSEEAQKYVTFQYGRPVYMIKDGKIIFSDYGGDWGNYGITLLPTWYNKESNKEAYELVRNLVMYAKENGHHVRLLLSTDVDTFCVRYYENEFYGIKNPLVYGTHFCFDMHLKPYKYSEKQNEYTYYTWVVSKLFKSTTQDIKAVNYREPDMVQALEIAFRSIYGNNLGQRIANYALNEYEKDHKEWEKGNQYHNLKIEYRPDLGGLEICNGNGGPTEVVYFSTNKK